MTYRDHANRHGYGGSDPALLGWESSGAGGGGSVTFEIKVYNETTTIVAGDGQRIFLISDDLDGYRLVDADAYVTTVSSSGNPTVQLRNVNSGADMLSTRITIDASEFTSYSAAVPPVIDGANATVSTGDRIAIDIDAVGVGAKGLGVIVEFSP